MLEQENHSQPAVFGQRTLEAETKVAVYDDSG